MSFFKEWILIEPRMLWLLVLLPVFLVMTWWGSRRRWRDMEKFSDVKLFQFLNPSLVVGGKSAWLQHLVYWTAVALLLLSIARPGGNPKMAEEEVTQKGVDIMLVVDLSASMKATDLKPDRMQATKAALKQFIEQMTTDRVGLTVFAGSVSLQSPLTQDYRTAKMMMEIINTNFLPVDGTAIGDALIYALDKIGEENRKDAVIILLTDGENTRGTSPDEALKKVKEAGTRVYTIGVGTAEGAKIPDGVDEKGNPRFKMFQGQPVVTKLDVELLERIAKETTGRYFAAETTQALMSAYAEIGRLTKKEYKEKKKSMKYQEFYEWLVLPALALLLLDIFLKRRARWWTWRKKAVEHDLS